MLSVQKGLKLWEIFLILVTITDFINLVKAKDTRVFVDKTVFIEKTNALLNTDGKLLAVTRPRRFGKTVTARMLSSYYSKG